MNYFELVKEFNDTFGHEYASSFPELTKERHDLRQNLNREEWMETVQAHVEGHRLGVLDGLVDLLYVLCGHWWEVSKDTVSINPFNLGLRKIGHHISDLDYYYEKGLHEPYLANIVLLCEGVLYAAELKFGLGIFNQAFDEVHRANKEKLWTSRETAYSEEIKKGEYIKKYAGGQYYVVTRPDGKIMKPPSWQAPELNKFL